MPSVCGLRTIRVSSPKNVLLLSEFCDTYGTHFSAKAEVVVGSGVMSVQ